MVILGVDNRLVSDSAFFERSLGFLEVRTVFPVSQVSVSVNVMRVRTQGLNV